MFKKCVLLVVAVAAASAESIFSLFKNVPATAENDAAMLFATQGEALYWSESQLQNFVDGVFRQCDSDRSGRLSRTEMNVPGFCKISDADYNRYANLFDSNKDYQFSWSEWYLVVRRNVNGNLVSLIETESDNTTGFFQSFTEGAEQTSLVSRGYVGRCPTASEVQRRYNQYDTYTCVNDRNVYMRCTAYTWGYACSSY